MLMTKTMAQRARTVLVLMMNCFLLGSSFSISYPLKKRVHSAERNQLSHTNQLSRKRYVNQLMIRGGVGWDVMTSNPNIVRDFIVAFGGLFGASIWLGIWTFLASTRKGRGSPWLDSKLTRKIVHSSSAPLFLMTWPLFSDSSSEKFVAALVPLFMVARLILARNGLQPTLVRLLPGALLILRFAN